MEKGVISSRMSEISPIIEECVENGTDVNFTIRGFSMYPLLYSLRDSVLLTKADKNNLKKFDIPLYVRPDGSYVLHRIVKVNKEKNSYDIVGDAQKEIERGVSGSTVIAVVKGFERKGRKFTTDNILYRIYVRLWYILMPVRPYICRIFLKAGKLILKLRKISDE
ncbi:MAG: hypothetical protein LUD81_00110 [Clostridiales bacterium]|nr:hypothetical protein [Clostridiales bacterium]